MINNLLCQKPNQVEQIPRSFKKNHNQHIFHDKIMLPGQFFWQLGIYFFSQYIIQKKEAPQQYRQDGRVADAERPAGHTCAA